MHDPLDKMVFGEDGRPSFEAECIRHFKAIREDHEAWVRLYETGTVGFNEDTFKWLLASHAKLRQATLTAVQFVYWQRTGRHLDHFEADKPGEPPPSGDPEA